MSVIRANNIFRYNTYDVCFVVTYHVHTSSSVGVVGEDAYLNLTFSNLSTAVNRAVRVPADNSSLIFFFTNSVSPSRLSSRVTYTGDLSQGILSFVLANVTLLDSGRYKFVQTGLLGGDVDLGGQVLVVAESPNILGITSLSMPAVVGEEYKLNCSTESRSVPFNHNLTMYSVWNENGVNITMGSKYGVNGTILTISNLDRKDNGAKFTCRAFEDQRRTSAESNEFVLNVFASSSVGVVGEDAYLIWIVSNLSIAVNRAVRNPADNATIMFFFKSSVFPSYSSPRVTYTGDLSQGILSFVLANVTLLDSGRYKFVQTGLLGGDVDLGGQVLVVAEIPYILGITSLSLSAVVGKEYKLNCSTESRSVPLNHNLTMYSVWKENGINVTMGSKYGVNRTILTISNLDRRDSGAKFTCSAFEDQRRISTESSEFVLNVLYGPNNIQIIPAGDLNVDEGRSVNITCSAECNPPCNSYQWQNGSDRTLVGSSRFLVIIEVRREHVGVYSCNVNNTAITNSASTQINLTVNYPPTVDIESKNGSHNETGLMIKCSAHGVPEQYTYRLTHRSLFSGNEIRHVSHEFISTGVIIHRFINPTYMDTGIYVCSVNNGILDYRDGSLDKNVSATIWIKGPPYTTSRETSFYADVGHSGRLVIEFYNSLLDPMVTWYKHNRGTLEKLLNADKYDMIIASGMVDVHFYSVQIHQPGFIATLLIRNVTEEDLSQYQVDVHNSIGEIYLILELRASGSKPLDKSNSGTDGIIIASAIGATVLLVIAVTIMGVILYRRRNASNKGNQVKGSNNPRSTEASTKKIECSKSKEIEEDQYLELQDINSEGSENLNIRSSRIEVYEKICSSPNDQEHAYSDLSKEERNEYENTNVSRNNVITSAPNQQKC